MKLLLFTITLFLLTACSIGTKETTTNNSASLQDSGSVSTTKPSPTPNVLTNE